MRFYRYESSKIYVVMLSLQSTSKWRQDNVEQNVINNPNINVVHGVDGGNGGKIRSLIAKYNIPLPLSLQTGKNERFYGKLGRWLSTIMLAKLSMDLGLQLVILEDDLLLPPDFEFPLELLSKRTKSIYCLGTWGDGYFFNPASSRSFLRKVYRDGIVMNNDQMIKRLPSTKSINLVSRNQYGIEENKRDDEVSSIRVRSQPIDFVYQAEHREGWRVLLAKKVFRKLTNDVVGVFEAASV